MNRRTSNIILLLLLLLFCFQSTSGADSCTFSTCYRCLTAAATGTCKWCSTPPAGCSSSCLLFSTTSSSACSLELSDCELIGQQGCGACNSDSRCVWGSRLIGSATCVVRGDEPLTFSETPCSARSNYDSCKACTSTWCRKSDCYGITSDMRPRSCRSSCAADETTIYSCTLESQQLLAGSSCPSTPPPTSMPTAENNVDATTSKSSKGSSLDDELAAFVARIIAIAVSVPLVLCILIVVGALGGHYFMKGWFARARQDAMAEGNPLYTMNSTTTPTTTSNAATTTSTDTQQQESTTGAATTTATTTIVV